MPDTKQRLTPRALLEIRIPHSPHLSPDARRVLFVVDQADFEESRWVSHLWMADLEGGKARPITFSYEGEHAPRWSPDGCWIAFLSSRPDMTEPPPPHDEETEEEAHKEQVWLLPGEGGEARRLTDMKEGVRAFRWMPDSRSLICLAPEARPQPMEYVHTDARKRRIDPTVENEEKFRQQFWRVEIEEKRPELLYTGDFGIAEFEVSPDGKRLVFNTNYSGEANDFHRYDLFVLDIERAEARKLIERAGSKWQARWSPDGTRIAFLANLDPEFSFSQECVWEVSAEGGELRNLFTHVPYDAAHLFGSHGDGHLYATVADRTRAPLVRVTAEGVSSLLAAGDCLDFDVGANGVIAAVVEDDKTVPELYVLQPDGERRALTELNKRFHEQFLLPRQEVIRWKSEEWEIEGVLVYPPDYPSGAPLPLIVQVHGGPKAHVTNTLRSYYQHVVWAAEGYLVLQPNFRGSAGYGNAFAVANRRDIGGGDYRDIMAGVDYLIEQGLADPQRMGIMGGSYGGFMTNWAISQTDRFAAAISEFGMFSLITSTANSEIARWELEYLGANYWEEPEIYRRCSPSTYIDRIRTPTLILHGDNDNNTFISNSKEMYHALRTRGVPVQFVHYPREGHGLREPNHKLDEMRRCLAWFDRYLKGAGAAPPLYRIGDRIEQEGYEFCVLRAEEAEYSGWEEEQGRLLEIAFSLASKDPAEEPWEFHLEQIRLLGPNEIACPLRGVPVDAGGGKTLVGGRDLSLTTHPDKETGRLSLALAVAFEIPAEGGDFVLRVDEFPPVALTVGAKEEGAGESETPSVQ